MFHIQTAGSHQKEHNAEHHIFVPPIQCQISTKLVGLFNNSIGQMSFLHDTNIFFESYLEKLNRYSARGFVTASRNSKHWQQQLQLFKFLDWIGRCFAENCSSRWKYMPPSTFLSTFRCAQLYTCIHCDMTQQEYSCRILNTCAVGLKQHFAKKKLTVESVSH